MLIRQLQKAGFSLKEADAIVKGDLNPDIILSRYHDLEQEIQASMIALEVVKSLATHVTGEEPDSAIRVNAAGQWHAELEKTAGEAHAKWLGRLGFSEKQQLYIRWVSRTLSNSGRYMKDFFAVFERMKRQGPGSRASTVKAFDTIVDNHRIKSILEIGCGKGQSSLVLAEISRAYITAIDNHQPFLEHLEARTSALGCEDRIEVKNMSMFAMPFADQTFDLIWSEGSAYFMGFKQALSAWRPLIRPGRYLFVSDAVWLTEQPSPACTDYFKVEYPGMSSALNRRNEAQAMGYEIVSHFTLPRQDWIDFYNDMEDCVQRAVVHRGMRPAYEKMIREIEIGRTYGKDYGNICLLLSPTA